LELHNYGDTPVLSILPQGASRGFALRRLRRRSHAGYKGKKPMFKATTFIGFAAGFALISSAAFAEQGDSSSYGTVGWGPVIPTQSLTPRDRDWNHDNSPLYQAGDSAEWLRQHGKGLFPFFK
jgi:hypothetical protein